MASEDAIQLLALVILIAASAFFSSAETALTTVNRIKLQAMADEGDKRAARVLKVIENSPKMLSTILIGNNLVNNFTTALATALAIKLIGNGSVGFVTGVLTIIILIFGEITPKNVCHRKFRETLACIRFCRFVSHEASDPRDRCHQLYLPFSAEMPACKCRPFFEYHDGDRASDDRRCQP